MAMYLMEELCRDIQKLREVMNDCNRKGISRYDFWMLRLYNTSSDRWGTRCRKGDRELRESGKLDKRRYMRCRGENWGQKHMVQGQIRSGERGGEMFTQSVV